MTAPVETRRAGRPRNEDTTATVLEAARDLLRHDGYSQLSIERVAARAGVAKTAIYRRWDSKELLVADALAAAEAPLVDPDTGEVERDLVVILTKVWVDRGEARRVLAVQVLAEARGNPTLAAAIRDRVVSPRRAIVQRALRRGVERGEIAEDVDLELASDLLAGPFIKRLLLDDGAAAPRGLPAKIVRLVLQGLAPR
ncbi:MAG TPA: TetR/AcrR family transcriptional regulator [Acidimicrobiales bacterium]|nr:TetR/AcrR family transcriptional regulator [Acidimicrobiales bacterium]